MWITSWQRRLCSAFYKTISNTNDQGCATLRPRWSAETHEVEEEGSSSTLGVNDNEGANGNTEEQLKYHRGNEIEHQAVIQIEKQTSIQVKHSDRGRDRIEETTLAMSEDEVRVIMPLVQAQSPTLQLTTDSLV